MSNPPSQKSRVSLVQLMVAVAILGIAASLVIPKHMRKMLQQRNEECLLELEKLVTAQTNYFKEHGQYTSNLSQLLWQPPQKPYFLYGFHPKSLSTPDKTGTTSQNPTQFCAQGKTCYSVERMRHADEHPLQPQDLPPTFFDPKQGFTIGCVGNIDPDPDLSRYTINQSGMVVEHQNDLK